MGRGPRPSAFSPTSGGPVEGHLVVVESPLLHVSDLLGRDPVNDQRGVVNRPQIVAEQGVRVPDFLEQAAVGDDLGRARDPDLVMMIVEVAELDMGVGGDFPGLVVHPEIGDGETGRTRGRSPSIEARCGNRSALTTAEARSKTCSGATGSGIGLLIDKPPRVGSVHIAHPWRTPPGFG